MSAALAWRRSLASQASIWPKNQVTTPQRLPKWPASLNSAHRCYSTPVAKIEPRLQLTITCNAPNCTTNHRSTHKFSKRAYEKGIVLVQCPACQSRHLIADHLGWFDSDDLTQGGKYKTIEELMRAKGEEVQRGEIFVEGVQLPAGDQTD